MSKQSAADHLSGTHLFPPQSSLSWLCIAYQRCCRASQADSSIFFQGATPSMSRLGKQKTCLAYWKSVLFISREGIGKIGSDFDFLMRSVPGWPGLDRPKGFNPRVAVRRMDVVITGQWVLIGGGKSRPRARWTILSPRLKNAIALDNLGYGHYVQIEVDSTPHFWHEGGRIWKSA